MKCDARSQPFTKPRSSQAKSFNGQALRSWSSGCRFDIFKDIAVMTGPGNGSQDGRAYVPEVFRLMCMLHSRAKCYCFLCRSLPTTVLLGARVVLCKAFHISRILFMLDSFSLHGPLAIRPHAAGVLCRPPNVSHTQASFCSSSGLRKNCHCNTSKQIEGSQAAEQAVASVLTLAASLAILLCDTPPSSARTLGRWPLLQRDVLYGDLQVRCHLCRVQR